MVTRDIWFGKGVCPVFCRYLEVLRLISIHPQLKCRFESSYLQLHGEGKVANDYSRLVQLGFEKFWSTRVVKGDVFIRGGKQFKNTNVTLQMLTRTSLGNGKVLRLLPHPLCEEAATRLAEQKALNVKTENPLEKRL